MRNLGRVPIPTTKQRINSEDRDDLEGMSELGAMLELKTLNLETD